VNLTFELTGNVAYQYIRIRTGGVHHGRNLTVYVRNWDYISPDQAHSPNATFTGDGFTCNTGFVGNGRICDPLLPEDVLNQRLRSIDPEGNVTRYEWDSQGFKNRTIFPDNTSDFYILNENGEIISHTNRAGHTTRYTRNDRGDVIVQTNPDNSTIHYEYNDEGYVSRIMNELSHSIWFEYDYNNNLIRETDRRGNVTRFYYDEEDNKIRVVHPDGSIELFEYDENNRVIRSEVNGIVTNYQQGDHGITRRTSNLEDTVYSYNSLGWVMRGSYNTGLQERYYYD
jgi:YD repeat-containing protein